MGDSSLSALKEERDQLLMQKSYWRKTVGSRYVPIMIAVGLAVMVIHLFAGIVLLVGVIIFSRAVDEHIKRMQEDYADIMNEIRILKDENEVQENRGH